MWNQPGYNTGFQSGFGAVPPATGGLPPSYGGGVPMGVDPYADPYGGTGGYGTTSYVTSDPGAYQYETVTTYTTTTYDAYGQPSYAPPPMSGGFGGDTSQYSYGVAPPSYVPQQPMSPQVPQQGFAGGATNYSQTYSQQGYGAYPQGGQQTPSSQQFGGQQSTYTQQSTQQTYAPTYAGGQTSQFGQPSGQQTPPPQQFGQPSGPSGQQTPPPQQYGQPSGQTPPPQQFGQPTQPTAPQQFGQPTQPTAPQPTPPQQPFGQQTPPPQQPFGQQRQGEAPPQPTGPTTPQQPPPQVTQPKPGPSAGQAPPQPMGGPSGQPQIKSGGPGPTGPGPAGGRGQPLPTPGPGPSGGRGQPLPTPGPGPAGGRGQPLPTPGPGPAGRGAPVPGGRGVPLPAGQPKPGPGGRGGGMAGGAMYDRTKGTVVQQQSGQGVHSFSTEETRSFSEHINEVLANDPDLRKWLPINPTSMDLFKACTEGVLICKLINQIKPGTIDPRKICVKQNMNTFEISQNHMLAIEAAGKLGMTVVNIGPSDLQAGTPHLILGLLWQIIRMGMLDKVSVDQHPEMLALMEEGEDVNHFVNLPPEQTLLRWFNYHLKRAGHPRTVSNFSSDIADSENYYVLLHQLDPQKCPMDGVRDPDPVRRAEGMLQNADRLGCRKFVQPVDVANGNSKLNLLFVANLFNEYLCIDDNRDREARERLQREAEAANRKRLAEEEARRKAEWAKEEEEWRKRMAAEEERLKHELSARRAQMDAEAEAKRRQLQEEEERLKARLRQEEEERRKKIEQEERERQARYAEEDRRREEEFRRRQADEAERRRQEEEKRRIEEERKRQEELMKRQEEERRRQWEEAERRREQERQEALRLQYEAEERAKREWAELQQKQQLWEQQQYLAQQQAAQEAAYQQQLWYMQQQALAAQQAAMYQTVTTTTTSSATAAPPPKKDTISRLYLTVAEARGLRSSDLLGIGKPDPYCILQMRDQRLQTRKEKSTTNPVWHQEFEFTFFGPTDELVVSMWDRDRFSKDDFLGQVVLRLADLSDGLRRWFPLTGRPGVREPHSIKGEIFLQVRYGR